MLATDKPVLATSSSQTMLSRGDMMLATDKPVLATSSSQTMLSRGDIMLATDKPVLATRSSQTMFCCRDMLASKIYYVISKRRAKKQSPRNLSTKKNFTCDAISKDATQFQFYTGLTVSQFTHLIICLSDDVDRLAFWQTRFHVGVGTVSVIVIT